uniref:Aminotransferase-like plant mobile domain-containing protein n=1 Tax=Hordeum vulgare subsp. vulgare TaxID=112509 RepID=A0A8I6WQ49_HORVV
MENHFLLNPEIDSKHRGKLLSEQKLVPLVTRTSKFDWRIHPLWVQRLKWSGLLPFARLVVEGTDTSKHTSIDGSLLTCLVDRWRPETHTFHFRWGEMAPTLQDVSMLLGLPLAGNPIGPLADPPEWQTELGARFLNIYANAPVLASEPHGPKFDWLQKFRIENFPGYPHVEMSDIQITRSLEAYLMWLLGKVMFTENHVTTVSARYIPIALEIASAQAPEQITPRSWGSAVLAATYRGMCNGCQLTTPKSAILGCPLFLQLWSWERFSIGRPNIDIEHGFNEGNLLDVDNIDMPTFGLCWTRRKKEPSILLNSMHIWSNTGEGHGHALFSTPIQMRFLTRIRLTLTRHMILLDQGSTRLS